MSVLAATQPVSYEPLEYRRRSAIDSICAAGFELAELFANPIVKHCMLEMIVRNMHNLIDINRTILLEDERCRGYVSHEVYNWDMKSFEDRMNIPNSYINLLNLEHPQTVAVTKLITDLDNMEKYLKMIMDASDINDVLTELDGCIHLLHIREDLELRYAVNSKMRGALKYAVANFEVVKQRTDKEMQSLLYETINRLTTDVFIMDPIEYRYKLGMQMAHFDMLEYKCNKAKREANFRKKHEKGFKRDLAMSNYMTDYYRDQVLDLKAKLEYWRWQYDRRMDKYEEERMLLKMDIRVLEKRFSDYRERFAWHRSQMEEFKQQEALTFWESTSYTSIETSETSSKLASTLRKARKKPGNFPIFGKGKKKKL